jgi:hypothetical protein
MLDKIKRKVNEILYPNTGWKERYEVERKESLKWECKYNTLHRQLAAILKEH